MRASPCGVTRPSRDKPEPLSSTGTSAPPFGAPKRVCHQPRTNSRDASTLAPPGRCRLSVKNSCCAITLLLYLLMSRITSASDGDSISNTGTKPAGATPSRTRPPSLPPISCHSPAIARAP